MAGEKDGWLPPDQRLLGPSNIATWILTITAILMALGLSEFLDPAPAAQNAAQQRRWALDAGSEHTKAYGHVIKNIASSTLQSAALRQRRDGRTLSQLMEHFQGLQRTEIEITSDFDALSWQPSDTINSFFQRGQFLYEEMLGAHPPCPHRIHLSHPHCYIVVTLLKSTGHRQVYETAIPPKRSIKFQTDEAPKANL